MIAPLLALAERRTYPDTFAGRLATFFESRPNEWIDGRELARIAGAYAWRSRVSDLRTLFGLTIENRQRKVQVGQSKVTVSEYRLLTWPDGRVYKKPEPVQEVSPETGSKS